MPKVQAFCQQFGYDIWQVQRKIYGLRRTDGVGLVQRAKPWKETSKSQKRKLVQPSPSPTQKKIKQQELPDSTISSFETEKAPPAPTKNKQQEMPDSTVSSLEAEKAPPAPTKINEPFVLQPLKACVQQLQSHVISSQTFLTTLDKDIQDLETKLAAKRTEREQASKLANQNAMACQKINEIILSLSPSSSSASSTSSSLSVTSSALLAQQTNSALEVLASAAAVDLRSSLSLL